MKLLLVLLSGCALSLVPPKDAVVLCQSSAECPFAQTCFVGKCVAADSNQAPSVAVTMPAARALTEVVLTATVSDFESERVSFLVEYSLDQSTWHLASLTGETSGDSSPVGIAHSLTWNALADLPTQLVGTERILNGIDAVFVRVTADDGQEHPLQPVVLAPFALGDHLPVLTLVETPSGVVGGNVKLGYTLSDGEHDPIAVVVEVFDGQRWHPAEVSPSSDATVGLSEGRHDFVWNATQLGFATFSGVQLRATPYDARPGETVTTAAFTVDNGSVVNGAPSVAITAVNTRPLADVSVSYAVSDPNGSPMPMPDLVTLQGQFWNGTDWQNATAASGLTAPPTGATGVLVWHAALDLATLQVDTDGEPSTFEATIVRANPELRFRLVPTDSTGASGHAAEVTFNAGNAPPVLTLSPITGSLSGAVPIELLLADSQSDLADVQLQFRANVADAWSEATVSLGTQNALATAPSGRVYVLVWNSGADLGGQNLSTLSLRARGIDHPGLGSHFGPWHMLNNLPLANQTAPRVDQVLVRRPQLSTGAGVVDIYYTLVDAESDPADVQIEVSGDDGITWTPCNEWPSAESHGRLNLAASPAGVRHAFLWDVSSSVFRNPSATQVRVRAADNGGAGAWSSTAVSHGLWRVDQTSGLGAPQSKFGDGCNDMRMRAADFTGDQVLDFVYLNDNQHSCTPRVSVNVMKSDGSSLLIDHFAAISPAPADVKPVDWNTDGILDLVLADSTQGFVAVAGGFSAPGLWNETFPAPQSYGGTGCSAVATGDINSDTVPDAVIACDAEVHLWLRAGTGFVDAGSLPHTVRDVALADMNADGKTDLLLTGAGFVRVLLGQGNAAFNAALQYPIAGTGVSLTVRDLSDDGTLDVVVAEYNEHAFSVLLGNGDGTLAQTQQYTTYGNPNQVGVGDVNGDHYLDLIVAAENADGLSVHLGYPDGYARSKGEFFPAQRITLFNANHDSVVVADINSDGITDVVTASRFWVFGFQRFLGQPVPTGGFSFEAPVVLNVNVSSGAEGAEIAAVDLDQDGAMDLLSNNYEVQFFRGRSPGFGIGDGTFELPAQSFFWGDASSNASGPLLDLDGDGVLDLVVAPNSAMSYRLGVSGFSFAPEISLGFGITSYGAAAGDYSGDGYPDIVAWTANDGMWAYTSNPGATFSGYNSSHSISGVGTQGAAMADLNSDGLSDIVAVGGEPSLGFQGTRVMLADGSGGFNTVTYGTDKQLQRVRIADFTGDGVPDVVTTRAAATDTSAADKSTYVLMYTNTAGVLSGPVQTNVSNSGPLAVGDFNQDGLNDLVVVDDPNKRGSTGGSFVRVLTANGPTGGFTITHNIAIADAPRSVTVADLNSDGVLDIVVGFATTPGIGVIDGVLFAPKPWTRPATQVGASAPLDRFGRKVFPVLSQRIEADTQLHLSLSGATALGPTQRVEGRGAPSGCFVFALPLKQTGANIEVARKTRGGQRSLLTRTMTPGPTSPDTFYVDVGNKVAHVCAETLGWFRPFLH